jgi:hypothetical protein
LIAKGAKEGEINERFGRVRLTYNKEGYVDIDIRTKLPTRDKN